MVVSGIVYGGSGMDWNSGLLQRGGPDHVSVVDAGAGALHVLASSAGWNGDWKRALGRVSIERGSSGSAGMVLAGDGAGTSERLAPQVDCRGIEIGSRGGKGLSTGGVMRRRRGLAACWLLL